MQEVLDEQQAGQTEKKTPAVVYGLTGSYAGLWGAIIIGEFEVFRGWMTGLATVAFLLLNFVLSVALLVTLRHEMSSRLRYYGYWMLGGQLWFVISVGQVFLGYTLTNSVVIFDLLAIAVLGSIGLFLVRYYKNRTQAAAWWAWLEQSIGWYLFLHVETLVAFLDFNPWYNAAPIIVAQIILLWLGAGGLLWRQYRHYTQLERQVSFLLYSSFGLVVSIIEIEATNSVFLELLLVLAILLLVRAIAHARTEHINSTQYD